MKIDSNNSEQEHRISKLKIKNLSPKSFKVTPITWNETEKAELKRITKKYKLKIDISIYLERLPIHFQTYTSNLMPDSNHVRHVTQTLSDSLQRLEDIITAAGPATLSQIAFNVESGHNSIIELQELLSPIRKGCLKTISKLPKTKVGRKNNPLNLNIINYMVDIYEVGTGLESTCGWDDIKGCYVGHCYNFLMDINHKILKKFDVLPQLSPRSLGKYLCEVLKKRKSRQTGT